MKIKYDTITDQAIAAALFMREGITFHGYTYEGDYYIELEGY